MTNLKSYLLNICIYCILLSPGLTAKNSSKISSDFILCRHCGFNIVSAAHVVNFRSPAAEEVYNETLFGLDYVEVQSLTNRLGIRFHVVTAKGGTCVGPSQPWQTDHSWYPGYAWKPCSCTRCSRHIGWVFEPLETAYSDRIYASVNGLYTFIIENVISEAYADSLLVKPKLNSYS